MKTNLENIELKKITNSKTNPRTSFEEEALDELTASIKEKGVLQPIGVRKEKDKYVLIYGERRYRAALSVYKAFTERNTIPAVIYESISQGEALELQIIENLQRKDIHPMEEAAAFKNLINLNDVKKFNVQEIAKRIGKSPSYVGQRLRLNELYNEFQHAFRKDYMTLTTALHICKISLAGQEELWKEDFAQDMEEGNLEVIEVKQWHLKRYLNDLNDAPFDTEDAELKKNAGNCASCPFNTAANTFLFPDMADKAICTNSPCFREKASLAFEKEINAALENPEIELISTAYEDFSAETTELINKGYKIYDRNSYCLVEKPDAPDLNEYQEELENENFKNEEEMLVAYKEQLKNYELALTEYNHRIVSGKFIRAFIVEGNGKGTYVYISFDKKVNEAKVTAKGLQEKFKNNSVKEDDIKSEIKRLQNNEKRKKELDEEKTQPLFYELLLKNETFATNGGALEREEKAVMLIMFAEYTGLALDKVFYKLAGIKNDSDHNHVKLFKALIKLEANDLDTIFQIIVRKAILSKLSPNKGTRPDNSGKAAALKTVCCLYDNTGVEKIWNVQMEARTKRELRLSQRVTELNTLVKDIKKK